MSAPAEWKYTWSVFDATGRDDLDDGEGHKVIPETLRVTGMDGDMYAVVEGHRRRANGAVSQRRGEVSYADFAAGLSLDDAPAWVQWAVHRQRWAEALMETAGMDRAAREVCGYISAMGDEEEPDAVWFDATVNDAVRAMRLFIDEADPEGEARDSVRLGVYARAVLQYLLSIIHAPEAAER